MEEFHKEFEETYQKSGEAPWTFKDPPTELVKLVENGTIKPCNVLDIGCGEGWYAIYLASNGFDVTGIDFSENAIKIAKQNAHKSNIKCKFFVMNWAELDTIKDKFDFIIDWRFLHEIVKEQKRKAYVEKVYRILNNGGKYISVSFNIQTEYFGKGNLRKLKKDQTLYFSSINELEILFNQYFNILEKKVITVTEKGIGEITSSFFLMEKVVKVTEKDLV